jgi:hypothetical protein
MICFCLNVHYQGQRVKEHLSKLRITDSQQNSRLEPSCIAMLISRATAVLSASGTDNKSGMWSLAKVPAKIILPAGSVSVLLTLRIYHQYSKQLAAWQMNLLCFLARHLCCFTIPHRVAWCGAGVARYVHWVATGWTTEESKFDSKQGQWYSSSPTPVWTACGLRQSPD